MPTYVSCLILKGQDKQTMPLITGWKDIQVSKYGGVGSSRAFVWDPPCLPPGRSLNSVLSGCFQEWLIKLLGGINLASKPICLPGG